MKEECFRSLLPENLFILEKIGKKFFKQIIVVILYCS